MSTPSLSKGEAIKQMALSAIENAKGRSYENACVVLMAALRDIAIVATIGEEKK